MRKQRAKKYAAALEWLRENDRGSTRESARSLCKEFDIKEGAAYHLVRDYRHGEFGDEGTEDCAPILIPSASKHDAFYRKHDQQYVFVFDLSATRKQIGKVAQFDMPVREVQFAIESYVYAGGAGMSQKQVCRALSQRFERKMTADFFKYFLSALGIDKNSLPIAPHRYNEEANDSIISSWREQQEAQIEVQKRSTDPEYWKERAHELKATLTDVEMFLERLPPVTCHVVESPARVWGQGIDHQLMFLISDWHVGAHADLEDVAKKLVKAFDEALLSMACMGIDAEKMPITLVVPGDMLDGVLGTMHHGQQSNQFSHGEDQVSSYVSQIITLVRYLFDLTSHPIDMYTVQGNHDRVGADRKQDPDRILHNVVAKWIQSEVKGMARVHMPPRGESILTGMLGYNTQLILYHGDNQPKDWRRTLLMHMDKSATYYLLVCGHRHTPEVRICEDLNVMVYQVGSPKAGLDRYAPDVIGVDSRPSQQILLIGPNGPQLPGQVFL